jgi:hypothetical protein
MIPFIPPTLPMTPARMNLMTKNMKYPITIAAAMGKPRSATNLKNISMDYLWQRFKITSSKIAPLTLPRIIPAHI